MKDDTLLFVGLLGLGYLFMKQMQDAGAQNNAFTPIPAGTTTALGTLQSPIENTAQGVDFINQALGSQILAGNNYAGETVARQVQLRQENARAINTAASIGTTTATMSGQLGNHTATIISTGSSPWNSYHGGNLK